MGIRAGAELLAVGEGDVLLLKRVEKSIIRREFEKTVVPIRRKIRRLGIRRSVVAEAVRKARKAA